MGLLWWLRGKESTCNAGEAEGVGLIPGLGRSPEGKKKNGNLLQSSCWEKPMDRWAMVHGVEKIQAKLSMQQARYL